MAKGNDTEIQSGRTLRGSQVGDNYGFGGMDCNTVPSKLPINRVQQLIGLIPSRYPGGLTTMPGLAYDDETPKDETGKNIYYSRFFKTSMLGPNNEEKQVTILIRSNDIRMKPRISTNSGEPKWEDSWSENLYERFNLGNLINDPSARVRRSVFLNSKTCQVVAHEGKIRISSGNGRHSPPIIMQYIDTQWFADSPTTDAVTDRMMPAIRLNYRDIWMGPALIEENEEVGDKQIPDDWFIQLAHNPTANNKIKQGTYSFSLSPILDEYQYGMPRGFKPRKPLNWDGSREWVISVTDGSSLPMINGAIVWKLGLNLTKRYDSVTRTYIISNYINPRLNKVALWVRFAPKEEPYTWSEPYLSCILDLNKIASHAQPIEDLSLLNDAEIENHWATLDSSMIEFYWWRDATTGQYAFKTAGIEYGGAFGGDTCSSLLGHNAHTLPSRERIAGAYYNYAYWYNGTMYAPKVTIPKKAAFEWLNQQYTTATGEFLTYPVRKASRTHDQSDWEERKDVYMYCAKSGGTKAMPDVIPAINYEDLGVEQNDEIVGAIEHNGMLNILTKNHRYPIVTEEFGSHKAAFSERYSGCKNPRSMLKLGDGTVIYSSQAGIKMLKGENSEIISTPIDNIYKSASQSYKGWMNEGWTAFSPEWNLLFVQFPAYGTALYENQKEGRHLTRLADGDDADKVRYVPNDALYQYKTSNYRVFVGCMEFLKHTGTVEWAEADFPIDMLDACTGNDGKMYIFDGRTIYKFGASITSEVRLTNAAGVMQTQLIMSKVYMLSQAIDNNNISMYKFWQELVTQYTTDVDLIIHFYINYSRKPLAFRTFSNPHEKYYPNYFTDSGKITRDVSRARDPNPINSQVPDIMDYRLLANSNNLTILNRMELHQEFKGKVIEFDIAMLDNLDSRFPSIRFENAHFVHAPIPSTNKPKPAIAGWEHIKEPITDIPRDPDNPNEYPRIPTLVPNNPIITPGDEQTEYKPPLPIVTEMPPPPRTTIPGTPVIILEPKDPGSDIIENPPPDPSTKLPTTVEQKPTSNVNDNLTKYSNVDMVEYNQAFKNKYALYVYEGAVLTDKSQTDISVSTLNNSGINLSNVKENVLSSFPTGSISSGTLTSGNISGDFTLTDAANIYLTANSRIKINTGSIEVKEYALTQNQDSDYLIIHPSAGGTIDIELTFLNQNSFDLTEFKYRLNRTVTTNIAYYIKVYNYTTSAYENYLYYNGSTTTFYKTYLTSNHIYLNRYCKFQIYITGKLATDYININQIRVLREVL